MIMTPFDLEIPYKDSFIFVSGKFSANEKIPDPSRPELFILQSGVEDVSIEFTDSYCGQRMESEKLKNIVVDKINEKLYEDWQSFMNL